MNISLQTKNVVLSWLRVFLVAAGSVFLADVADGGFHGLAWEAMAIAGTLSAGPVILNWLNPNDPRYGRGFEDPDTNPIVVDADDTDGMDG